MNKIIITFITMAFVFSIHAQSKTKLTIETQGGYEHNYFKSPKQVQINGELFNADNLIASSLLQDIDLDFDYSYKWKKNRLRFSVNPNARIFYENVDDSYWSISTFAKYDYDITRTTRFLAEVSFRRMDREGLDGAQDVLVNPLGFTNYGASTGLEFSPFKKNQTTVELFYNFRDFDAFGTRDLEFDEFGIKMATEQEFRVNRLKHKYGIEAYFKKRLYDTFNASDIDSEGERDWSYIKIAPFYEYPISKQLDIEASFQLYQRIDNLIQRSGFNQFGPELTIRYKNKGTKIYANTSYIIRNYTDIEAQDNEGTIGEKVRYDYVNFRLNAEQQLTDRLRLVGTLYSRIRTTNNTNIEARSFRDYRNQFITIGLQWQF
ncbi:MAG: hypothetical protein AAFX55_07950 [Bacteroidota bacterium]